MKPEFKIKKNKQGKYEVYYIYKHRTFFNKEVLKPYITWSGLDKVYPFSTLETAIKELKIEITKNTYIC